MDIPLPGMKPMHPARHWKGKPMSCICDKCGKRVGDHRSDCTCEDDDE